MNTDMVLLAKRKLFPDILVTNETVNAFSASMHNTCRLTLQR